MRKKGLSYERQHQKKPSMQAMEINLPQIQKGSFQQEEEERDQGARDAAKK